MGVVFENTKRLPVHRGPNKGAITPYLNAGATGLPLEVDESERDKLGSVGTPVPVPEGLETTHIDELRQAA